MTTISTFATAVDVTISELRLEAFLPVDQATAAILSSRGESPPSVRAKRTVNSNSSYRTDRGGSSWPGAPVRWDSGFD
jgi:hypothetical protein